MNADPSSSAPVFSGGPGAPNNTSSPSNQGNGWNHLWLLLLIPIILLMILLIFATWYVVRRRRKARQRRSMLRNVTLVVREEEEKRDREEKRLTRGNSIASKLGRSKSLKEARERRFEQRVSRAIAKEQKEARGGGHQQLPSEDSTEAAGSTAPRKGESKDDDHEAALAGGAALAGTAVALKRSGSAKHRDREVAERVWKVSSDDGGAKSTPPAEKPKKRKSLSGRSARRGAVAAVLPRASGPDRERDVEAEAGNAAPASDSEDLSGNESDKSGSMGHVRPHRRREDSHPLSIIGESGLSEGAPSRDLSRSDLLATPDRPRTGESAAAAAAPIAAESLPASPKPVYVAGAAAAGSNSALAPTRQASIRRTPSQRSRYTTATSASHYTTAESATADDSASLRTARTGGTVTAVPLDAAPASASVAPSSSAGHDVDPFRSPTSPVSSSHATHDGAAANPFASPTESSAGHSSFAGPAAAAAAVAPKTAAAAESKSPPHDDPAAASSGLASRISSVIRLKQPTPPTKKSAADLNRVPSGSSSSTKPKRSASFSAKKKQRRTAAAGAAASSTPASPTTPKSPAAESWAYTPRAAEWRRSSLSKDTATAAAKRVSESSSVPSLRFTSDANANNAAAAPGHLEDDAPPVPALSLPANKSSEAVVHSQSAAEAEDGLTANRGLDGRPWVDAAPRSPLTPQAQAQVPLQLKRQNSIGVAGSRFKETFDDE